MIAATLIFLLATGALGAAATNTFVVAAYNVENWVLMERDGLPDQSKPDAEKTAVADVLAAVRPDVLGLEEIGTTNELAELAGLLAARGLEYPHSEWIQGWDTNRHVALLSRFPITERHSRNDYSFKIENNVLFHSRGVLDVRVQVNPQYSFRAVVAHLKSKRQHDLYDQTVMRREEARLLRTHVAGALEREAALNLIVMGDLNDTPETETVQTIIGQPPLQLMDLMPQDSTGGYQTHLWRYRGVWSRIDYLLASPGMAHEYVTGSARIADMAGHDRASDHRAVYASFRTEESVPIVETASPPADSPISGRLIFALVAAVIVADVVVVLWILSRRRPPPASP